MRGDQIFVQVSFDFDYISEDGKHVHMKENEILLLINKTNHDWWQVCTLTKDISYDFYFHSYYLHLEFFKLTFI